MANCQKKNNCQNLNVGEVDPVFEAMIIVVANVMVVGVASIGAAMRQ